MTCKAAAGVSIPCQQAAQSISVRAAGFQVQIVPVNANFKFAPFACNSSSIFRMHDAERQACLHTAVNQTVQINFKLSIEQVG